MCNFPIKSVIKESTGEIQEGVGETVIFSGTWVWVKTSHFSTDDG